MNLAMVASTIGVIEINHTANANDMTPEKACETYYMMRSMGMRMQYIAQMHIFVPKDGEREMYRLAIRYCPEVFEAR